MIQPQIQPQIQPINQNHIPRVYDPEMQIQRSLRGGIDEIGVVLRESNLNDELSTLIRQWHVNFTKALELKNIDLNPIAEEFLDLLQGVLTMPGINIPYDDETVLGSDGQAYGYKILCLFYSKTNAPFSERSPLRPDDPTPFKASPHAIARFLVSWLKIYRPNFTSERVDREFSQLASIPEIPGLSKSIAQAKKGLTDKIQHIQQQQLKREKKKEERRQIADRQFEVLDQVIDQVVVEKFAELNQQIAENHAAKNELLDQHEQNFEHAVDALRQHYDSLDRRGEILEADIADLKIELAHIGAQVVSAQADNIRLKIAIIETQKALNKREKGFWKQILMVGAVIIGSYIATWAVGSLVSSLGSTSMGASTTFTTNSVRSNLFIKY